MKLSPILLITINETLRISGFLSPATIGQSYLATLTGYAGLPPYVWSISGALPDGVTVTTDSNNDYVFSGTPTEAGKFPIVVTIMDSEGRSVSRSFDLLSQALPLTISGHLPNGTVGGTAAYSYTLGGGAGARVVTVYSGSLPSGASISTAGAVSGTYTTAGSYSWVLQVEDSLGSKTYLSDSNAIAYATLSSTGALTDADVGDPVGGSITLSGGDGTYTVDASPVSGTRPAGNGLALVGAVYSDSSGVLTTAATYTWTDRFRSGDGQTLDVPSSITVSAVYATWNPLDKSSGITLSNGDSRADGSGGYNNVRSTSSVSGKRYFEMLINVTTTGGNSAGHGVADGTEGLNSPSYAGATNLSAGLWIPPGNVFKNGASIGFGIGPQAVGVTRTEWAVDSATRKVWVRKHGGSWLGSGDPTAGTSPTVTLSGSGGIFAMATPYTAGEWSDLVSDPANMTGAAPSGFTAGL